jgi:two-component system phosphate regulon sensor histidine kinase PhoR
MPGTKHRTPGKGAPDAAVHRRAPARRSADRVREALALEVEELHGEIEALRAEGELKDQYLSVATHELSAPLAAMKAYLEALLEHHAEPGFTQTQDFLQVLAKETDRLIRLVDRTLEISRLTSRGLRIETGPVDVQEVVADLLPSLRPMLAERAMQLEVEVPPDLPRVLADRDLLKQVLLNLIHNGVKFSLPGRRVMLRARALPDAVEIEVEDEGYGIPQEDMAHLFQPYFRSADERVERQRGTGLGLSIVKTIVEQHGGSIGVESRPEAGTTFRFTLPRV